MAKNLVVFCDGTGNELKAKGVTNVLRLHGLTVRNEQQLTFYQAGIGTRGSPQALTPIGRGLTRFIIHRSADPDRVSSTSWAPGSSTCSACYAVT